MLLPSPAPRFNFFFQLFFWSEGRVDSQTLFIQGRDRHWRLQRAPSICLSAEVQIHCTSMLCGSEISKTMFPFFTAPLFSMPFSCPSLSLVPPACSWECTGKCCGLSLGGGCCQAAEWGLWGDGAPWENFCGSCLLREGWDACFS